MASKGWSGFSFRPKFQSLTPNGAADVTYNSTFDHRYKSNIFTLQRTHLGEEELYDHNVINKNIQASEGSQARDCRPRQLS